MRPIYENAATLAKEKALAQKVANELQITLYKQDFKICPIDYKSDCLLNENFYEIKCRNYTWEQLDNFGGFFISLKKWEYGLKETLKGNMFSIIVEDKDGVSKILFIKYPEYPPPDVIIKTGGRVDRCDSQDIEKVVCIDSSKFQYTFRFSKRSEIE